MAKAMYSNAAESTKKKIGLQHGFVMGILVAVFFAFIFLSAIPSGLSSFILPLFKPDGELMQKIGFVKFDGLVWASTTKDKEANLLGQELEVKKDYINKEFIFDFSQGVRTEEESGYVKGKWEFYIKAPALGEHPLYLEPWIGFTLVSIAFSVIFAGFITMLMPTKIGYMAALFDRQIDNTQIKIRLQTGFSDDVVHVLTLPDDKLEDMDRREVERALRRVWERTVSDAEVSSRQAITFDELFDDDTDIVMFRNEAIYSRIKEFFSDFVVKEIEDTKNGLLWRRNRLKFGKGLRLYMSHHFTEKYANNVTGMAYGGAAVLIVAIGVRGLKLIPAARPSWILLAIGLEFTMLGLMAFTLFYTEEEERMDKMLKKMEDANRSQLETLKGQQEDIHQLSTALVGQTSQIIKNRVESAISEYMTSGDHVQKMVAEEIAQKIMLGVRNTSEKK